MADASGAASALPTGARSRLDTPSSWITRCSSDLLQPDAAPTSSDAHRNLDVDPTNAADVRCACQPSRSATHFL
jgi:hypothetical protein